jgi:hypothetical protein
MANEFARALRKRMTPAEVKLWVRLRTWRKAGYHFLACPRFHGHLDKVFKWDREFRPWVRTGGRSAVSTSSRR